MWICPLKEKEKKKSITGVITACNASVKLKGFSFAGNVKETLVIFEAVVLQLWENITLQVALVPSDSHRRMGAKY